MTLTEYLQNAVTELRTPVCKICTGHEDPKRGALADHVETMVNEHAELPHTGGLKFCRTCTEIDKHCRIFAAPSPCPSLRSVAQLVATATGIPAPEGAE